MNRHTPDHGGVASPRSPRASSLLRCCYLRSESHPRGWHVAREIGDLDPHDQPAPWGAPRIAARCGVRRFFKPSSSAHCSPADSPSNSFFGTVAATRATCSQLPARAPRSQCSRMYSRIRSPVRSESITFPEPPLLGQAGHLQK
jgi:hypothetical protein